MVAHGPVFCDITWGAGGTTADVTLDIASKMQNQVRAGQLGCDGGGHAPMQAGCAYMRPPFTTTPPAAATWLVRRSASTP
jgi:hypothetical protein